MPWVCNFGVCPDNERECEDCEHNSADNNVHWVDKVESNTNGDDLSVAMEKVMKGIKCGNCSECPYFNETNCQQAIDKDVTDLLNAQRAEIEKLKANPQVIHCKDCLFHKEFEDKDEPLIWCLIHNFGRRPEYFCGDAKPEEDASKGE